MNLYYEFGGWMLAFAVLVTAAVSDALGIWTGWLSTH
jgi:hypothetical protein